MNFAKNKNHKMKSRLKDRQLDFAKMPLNRTTKGDVCLPVCNSEEEVQQLGLPPPSNTWTVQKRSSFAGVDFTSEEASEEPITTCMTLFSGTCCCCYL